MGTWDIFPLLRKEGSCSLRRWQCWSTEPYGPVQRSQKLLCLSMAKINFKNLTLPQNHSKHPEAISWEKPHTCAGSAVPGPVGCPCKPGSSCRSWCGNGEGGTRAAFAMDVARRPLPTLGGLKASLEVTPGRLLLGGERRKGAEGNGEGAPPQPCGPGLSTACDTP